LFNNNQSKLKTLSVSRCTWWRTLKGLLDATQDGPKARAAPEDVAAHVAVATILWLAFLTNASTPSIPNCKSFQESWRVKLF
jgi:hypothetical protein